MTLPRRQPRPTANPQSPYRGVYWHPRSHKWQAQIELDGKTRYIGKFDDDADAGRAYDAVARTLLGDAATLNFPASNGE